MKRNQRFWLAALLAPLAPVLMILAPQGLGVARFDMSGPSGATILFAIGAGSYACTYSIGIPAYLVLRKLSTRRWYHYLIAAAISGAFIPPLVFLILELAVFFLGGTEMFIFYGRMIWDKAPQMEFAPLAFAFLLAPVGLLFWAIERPGKS